ncbi:hypothetical protein BD324DRAFT_649450 [Kockovaella imperatae]|uniref:Mini-chromosome maintenance replisome factor-domain-containing protein n=1 Tax=Kockovaella imperatae TaxID=4999 RepID=A0A1Y1UPC8_9TREE|nr:hypothetical protein BD324DRAFT_649450 [Kockovaella imperatae]ORX39374.1 hypothetical protein BD324DRAFT_649450 [Kockovaella imperatae]
MDLRSILRTALREHDGDETEYISRIETELEGDISPFSPGSSSLSLVRFDCMLQDVGYPMEVYSEGSDDWSDLKERWVGWAVEIPGSSRSSSTNTLPESLHSKFPLENHGDYLGALLKVYDEGPSREPAALVRVVGVVSSAPMPALEDVMVPCIHVLRSGPVPKPLSSPCSRQELLDYFTASFSPPDSLAAEYLLLSLISSPSARPTGLPPLGTLSLNFIGGSLKPLLNQLTRTVTLSLSLPNLHSSSFQPHSPDSTSLNSGRLQLPSGTVVLVDEDAMGQGGKLETKAVKNLQALSDCMKSQMLGYEYPYMDNLKMKCELRFIVTSQGKSMLPLDVHLPVGSMTQPSTPPPQGSDALLAQLGSSEHAAKLEIPEDVAKEIQESFVTSRKAGGNANDAEATLTRRMRIARLIALSNDDAKLSESVWARAVEMDTQARERMSGRRDVPAE